MPIKVSHHPDLKTLGLFAGKAGDGFYRLRCVDEKLRKIRDADRARSAGATPPFPKTLCGLPYRHD